MNRIKGKLILVTGASSGIGEACARRFAAEGADLILWARRADRLERLAAELGATHRVSLSLAAVDVRDRTAVNGAAEALVRPVACPTSSSTTRGSRAASRRFTKVIPRTGIA